jgi:DNA-binding YbaB/EbfC family protein
MVGIGKLKQVLEMRKAAKNMQSALSDVVVVGEAAKGLVKVHMDGNQKITQVEIDPSLLNLDKQTTVQEGIVDAHRKAQRQLQEIMAAKVRSGELKLPDLNI